MKTTGLIALWLIALWLLSPYFALLGFASKASFTLPSFFATTLFTTISLIICVLFFAGGIGLLAAFTLHYVDLRHKKLLTVLLILPLTLPPYLLAFLWGDMLDGQGVVQQFYREMMGYKLRRDYWFFEPKSFAGAVFVFSLALYPYVFLTLQAYLKCLNPHYVASALSLGANRWQVLRRIPLKIATPALLAGLLMVGFETLNDIGVAKYSGVVTLPMMIMTKWQEQNNLGDASLLSLLIFGVIACGLWVQTRLLRHVKSAKAHNHHSTLFKPLGWRLWGVQSLLIMPAIFGFLMPLIYMLSLLKMSSFELKPMITSVIIAFFTAITALLFASALLMLQRRNAKVSMRLFALSYALPGSILGVGLLGVYIYIGGSWLLNSIIGLILGLSIRFLFQIYEQVQAASGAVSPHILLAAKSLGAKPLTRLWKIELPLLRPAFYSGVILVMIEAMKELPLTLMLRPIGYETLSLSIYDAVERGNLESVALNCLAMCLIGCISVWLLIRKNG